MNDEQIKDIIIALINNNKLCAYGVTVRDYIENNTNDIIKAYNILKESIGEK